MSQHRQRSEHAERDQSEHAPDDQGHHPSGRPPPTPGQAERAAVRSVSIRDAVGGGAVGEAPPVEAL